MFENDQVKEGDFWLELYFNKNILDFIRLNTNTTI